MGKHLSAKTAAPHLVETLAESHQQFLGFLERRVGDRVLAEDLLQAAYMNGTHHALLPPTFTQPARPQRHGPLP